MVLLSIVCGIVVFVGVGAVMLFCFCNGYKKQNRTSGGGDDKDKEGGGEGGAGGRTRSERLAAMMALPPASKASPPASRSASVAHVANGKSSPAASRSASLAHIAAPFEGGAAWNAAVDGEAFDLEGQRGKRGGGGGGGGAGHGRRNIKMMRSNSSMGPTFANPLYSVRANSSKVSKGRATASPSAAGDDDHNYYDYGKDDDEDDDEDDGEDDGDDQEQDEGEEKVRGRKGEFHLGDAGGDDAVVHGGRGRGRRLGGGDGGTRSMSSHEEKTEEDGGDVLGSEGTAAAAAAAAAAPTGRRSPSPERRSSAPEPLQGHHDPDPAPEDGGDPLILPRRLSQGDNLDGGARGGAAAEAAAAAAATAAAAAAGWRPFPYSNSPAASSVLKVAEGVVKGAESLSPLEAYVPGAREALGVVAALARLAAADHRSDSKDMKRRVRWCQGVVLTLERARDVLGKVSELGSRGGWGCVLALFLGQHQELLVRRQPTGDLCVPCHCRRHCSRRV